MGEVFQFLSSASLEMLTGQKARDLEELLNLIKTCSGTSIFYHTFSAFLKLREIQLPHNSDFAIWASRSLNEKALAEKLIAVDFSEHNTIESLRTQFIDTIEAYKQETPRAFEKMADVPFYLYDIVRIEYRTDKFAYDLRSFRDLIETVSIYSIYLHFIESRQRRHLQGDDFSAWIEADLEMPDLAQKIRRIDINVHTMEGLRGRIIQLIDEHLNPKISKN
jgi:hypothetical protein